ncbi:DUF2190 family protein [Thermogutta sp.]|jgi:predicted RecA/RadA family phage recombinase|uniref:DUF2190 family protein n=1 Tax=Thermogutta sp. TaxID=1962930 RepID=UPI00321FF499
MANMFRLIRGEPNSLSLPKYASDSIDIGDLLFWDSTNSAVRPASAVSGADYATKAANFAAAFVGVAMSSHAAGSTDNVLVATNGDFEFDCPTGTAYVPLDGVQIGNGSAVANQTVVKTATAANMIGKVIAPKAASATKVKVRITTKFML